MPSHSKRIPDVRLSTVFLAALSLSIGWGIRGNFGHEYGAMIPGALTGIVVCLLSGREDWRKRVAYFGMFGALGWAFGASISYGNVIAYSHSGEWDTSLYGFFSLYVIGFLWGGLGGAGTALPAVADRDRLTGLFRPLCWVFVLWTVLSLGQGPMIEWYRSKIWSGDTYDTVWFRQTSPFYWFDADWLPAVFALVALCLFDLWDRCACEPFESQPKLVANKERTFVRFMFIGLTIGILAHLILKCTGATPILAAMFREYFYETALYDRATLLGKLFHACVRFRAYTGFVAGALPALLIFTFAYRKWVWAAKLRFFAEFLKMAAYAAPAALVGGGIHLFLRLTHLDVILIHRLFVRPLGDITRFRVEDLLINWPQLFVDISAHLGWVFGLLIGLGIYFVRNGKWRSDSALFLHMALGWLIAFLILPTLLDIRMTPPRSDDWAGILGVWIGAMIYLLRHRLAPVAYASLISAFVGGLGFSGIACLKLIMVAPGNPHRLNPTGMTPSPTAEIEATWAHWQSANWHSFLEQSYGFVNGIGIAIALGLLASRIMRHDSDSDIKRVRPWTEIFAVAFVLVLLTYLNLFKNVAQWTRVVTENYRPVPVMMKAPLFDSIEWSAAAWFNLTYALIACCVISLLIIHRKRSLSFIPTTWLGKGQLLYLVFLWVMVIGNFERALVGFHEQRLITEWVIIVNALIATALILLLPKEDDTYTERRTMFYGPLIAQASIVGLAIVVLGIFGEFGIIRSIYGTAWAGHAGNQLRFGDNAEWRIKPILKNKEHR